MGVPQPTVAARSRFQIILPVFGVERGDERSERRGAVVILIEEHAVLVEHGRSRAAVVVAEVAEPVCQTILPLKSNAARPCVPNEA